MSHPRIRIIRHEAVPKTGSFEVRFADGRESKYFYFDDVPGRRLRPEIPKAFARAEKDKDYRTGRPSATLPRAPGAPPLTTAKIPSRPKQVLPPNHAVLVVRLYASAAICLPQGTLRLTATCR